MGEDIRGQRYLTAVVKESLALLKHIFGIHGAGVAQRLDRANNFTTKLLRGYQPILGEHVDELLSLIIDEFERERKTRNISILDDLHPKDQRWLQLFAQHLARIDVAVKKYHGHVIRGMRKQGDAIATSIKDLSADCATLSPDGWEDLETANVLLQAHVKRSRKLLDALAHYDQAISTLREELKQICEESMTA